MKRFSFKTKIFRISVSLLVGFIILAGVAIAISYKYPQIPIKAFLWWNYSKKKAPYAYVVPNGIIVIDDKSIDNSGLKKISVKAMDLYLPHSTIIKKIHRMKSTDAVAIILTNEKSIFIDPSIPNFTEQLEQDPEFDRQKFMAVYGSEMFSTAFDFHQAIAKTTPDSVSIYSSPDQAVRAQVFLLYKVIINPFATKGGFFLKVGEINGIQFGDPSKGDMLVIVNLYPPDNKHYQLTFNRFEQHDIVNVLSLIRYRYINDLKQLN